MTLAELVPITLEVLGAMDGAAERWIPQAEIEAAVNVRLVQDGKLQAGYKLGQGALTHPLGELKRAGKIREHSTIRFNGRNCTGDVFYRLKVQVPSQN